MKRTTSHATLQPLEKAHDLLFMLSGLLASKFNCAWNEG